MKYDFTSMIDRYGKDAIAFDGVGHLGWAPAAPRAGFDLIPMWVADMCFATAPSVTRAIAERLSHPIFGYFGTREEYFSAIIDWQRRQNGVTDLAPAHIGYENGVLGGLASTLAALCKRGDSVLVHSPMYMGFARTLENNGYRAVLSPLVLDANGVFRMDFADMEKKIVENDIRAAIFCSPHNPSGRVWEREEIAEAMEIYRRHGVTVISDEIWSDILLDGHRHIPTQSVSADARERTVALYAPSKTFNLAGLVGAYHIIYNDALREKVEKAASLSHYNDMNVLSMHALIGAYSEAGREWLSELLAVLSENVRYACDYIEEHFAGVKVSRPQGTYMVFMDCAKWLASHGKTLDELLALGWDVGVAWQDGRQHGGTLHIRLNLALPHARLCEALVRMDRYVFNAEVPL